MEEFFDKICEYANNEIKLGNNKPEDSLRMDVSEDYVVIYKGDYDKIEELRLKEFVKFRRMTEEEMVEFKEMDKKEIEQIRKIIKLKRLKKQAAELEYEIDLINT